MTEHRTIYPCSCGANEYLDISIHQEDGEDEVCVWAVVNPPRLFVDRLRGAWGILTGRDHYINGEVILTKDQTIAIWQDLKSRVGGMEVFVTTTNDNGEVVSRQLERALRKARRAETIRTVMK